MKITEINKNICMSDAYIEKDTLYTIGLDWNIIFEFNLENLELKAVNGFKPSSSFKCFSVFKYEDSIFYVSKNSYEIVEYDKLQKKFMHYQTLNDVVKNELLRSICRVGNEIWLFQKAEKTQIVKFSLEEREYTQYEIEIEGNINDYTPLSFESSICINSHIWRCIPGTSDLLVFDIKNQKMNVLKTNLKKAFLTMTYEDGYIYILTSDGKHFISLNSSSYETIVYETGYIGNIELPFCEAIKIGNVFFFIPCFEQKIFIYEMKSKNFSFKQCLQLPKEFKKIHDVDNRSLFWGWQKERNGLYLFPFAGNGLLCIDLDSLEIMNKPIKMLQEDYFIWLLRDEKIQVEGEMSLKAYLKLLVNGFTIDEEKEKEMEQGKRNWEQLFRF